jgi:Spy/CpxP family protein refolding chaperone
MNLKITPIRLLGALLLLTSAAAPAQTMERTLQRAAPGRWWRNAQQAETLALTPDQQKKMDEVFDQSRLKLIDLTASLDKEEALLDPLVEAEQPDAAKVRAQIDRIVQARSELERANANMLLGIRLVLTQDQWKKLQASGPKPRRIPADGAAAGTSGAPTPKKVR